MWNTVNLNEVIKTLFVAAITAALVVSCSKNDAVGSSNDDGIIGFSSDIAGDGTIRILERKGGALRVCKYQGQSLEFQGCMILPPAS